MRPLKMHPTSRSSIGCSTWNSSTRPFSTTATRVSSFSTFTTISRFFVFRLNSQPNIVKSCKSACQCRKTASAARPWIATLWSTPIAIIITSMKVPP